MEIKQTDDGKRGSFYIEVDGNVEGEMIYVWDDNNKIIIEHTEVSEKLKGQSAGKQMVNKAVDFAREKHIKILPLCSFADAILHKSPAYQDVLV